MSLSDKIRKSPYPYVIIVEDVKEFIKKLKYELTGYSKSFVAEQTRNKIDKLVGDKLI